MTSPVASLVEGSPEWVKLRQKCQTDLYFLAETILGYGPLVPLDPAVHGLLCRVVTRRTGVPALDDCPYRKIEMPRGTGKTTLITICYALQRILRDPNISILLCNEREQNAKDFLSELKHHFESNDLLRALFPDICPAEQHAETWSSTRITVVRTSGRKEPTAFIIGAGGTVTGMHPDIIIVDDILSREAMENSRVGGGQLMQQLNRWLHQLKPLLNYNHQPFPEILFVGTRWWFGDSYEHIEEWLGYGEDPTPYLLRWRLPDGTDQTLTVTRVGDLVCFTRSAIEDGRSIFPQKWTLEDLAKLRMEDPVLFAANYMNKPTDDLTAVFKPGWLQYYDWLSAGQVKLVKGDGTTLIANVEDMERILYVDPGGFGVAHGGDVARAAMVMVGTLREGGHVLLDVFSEKDTYLNTIRQIAAWCHRYRPRKVKIEQAGQQAAFIELVRRELETQKVYVTLEVVTPKSKVKEQRIYQLEPFFQRGMVYIGRGARFMEFRTQLEQFPRAARKDLLDALAYAAEDWARVTRATSPQERHAKELATYRERRGLTWGR